MDPLMASGCSLSAWALWPSRVSCTYSGPRLCSPCPPAVTWLSPGPCLGAQLPTFLIENDQWLVLLPPSWGGLGPLTSMLCKPPSTQLIPVPSQKVGVRDPFWPPACLRMWYGGRGP